MCLLKLEEDKYMRRIVLILCITLSKVISPPFGLSPFPTSCLITGWACSRQTTFFVIMCSSFLADIMLSFTRGYPILGYWSFFTHTGFLWIAFKGRDLFDQSINNPTIFSKFLSMFRGITILSLGFWLWTIFGVWIF